jgi:hypothetical protein
MRKFKTCRSRTLAFRLLLIVAGALMLMAAFAPRANASLIAYFNFEDSTNGGAPDFHSDSPPAFLGSTTIITTNYGAGDMNSLAPGLALNVAPGDLDPNLLALNLRRSNPNNGAHFDIPLFAAPTLFTNMTVTFATQGNGNGFHLVQLFYSTNGGGTFTAGPSVVLTTALQLVTLAVPVGANNAPLLVLRLVFTGGTSNGNDNQTQIDNIQVNGTIVPEPATVAGGLFGILGLCWHQRRRLRLLLPRLRRA